MIKKSGFCFLLMLLIFSVYPCSVSAQEPQDIQLPKPQTDGGKPLMQALALRLKKAGGGILLSKTDFDILEGNVMVVPVHVFLATI
jgi:hypothetical protein